MTNIGQVQLEIGACADAGVPTIPMTRENTDPHSGARRTDDLKPLTGRDLAQAGAQAAADHADRVVESWSERAYGYVCDCAAKNPHLTPEMVRKDAEARGLPLPPDGRAWGAVMLRAARAGLIRKEGWTTASDPRSHSRPISFWRSLVWGGVA